MRIWYIGHQPQAWGYPGLLHVLSMPGPGKLLLYYSVRALFGPQNLPSAVYDLVGLAVRNLNRLGSTPDRYMYTSNPDALHQATY